MQRLCQTCKFDTAAAPTSPSSPSQSRQQHPPPPCLLTLLPRCRPARSRRLACSGPDALPTDGAQQPKPCAGIRGGATRATAARRISAWMPRVAFATSRCATKSTLRYVTTKTSRGRPSPTYSQPQQLSIAPPHPPQLLWEGCITYPKYHIPKASPTQSITYPKHHLPKASPTQSCSLVPACPPGVADCP